MLEVDLRISFLALAIASKNPKPSVKLLQSGCDLSQSVKLGVELPVQELRDSRGASYKKFDYIIFA